MFGSSTLGRLGLGGLLGGIAAIAGGSALDSDLGALLAAYGALLVPAALYLLTGLAIRSRIGVRRETRPAEAVTSSPVEGAPVRS